MITAVLTQVLPSEQGDLDDCWVLATIMAALASDPTLKAPTITQFRAAAGDPDDGINDGGSLAEIMLACRKLWPHLKVTEGRGISWTTFRSALMEGRPASLAVTSRYLPQTYGFLGSHQVAVYWQDHEFYIANPLARQGSKPTVIREYDLKRAATDYGYGTVYAAIFPAPSKEAPMLQFRLRPNGRTPGVFVASRDGHAFNVATRSPRAFPSGYRRNVVALVELAERLSVNLDVGKPMLLTVYGDQWELIAEADGTFEPIGCDAEVAAAVAADRAKARIVYS